MNIHRVAVIGSIAVVVAAVIAGLWLIGSPADQRQQRLDERRVSDLEQLSQAVYRHRNERRALPASRGEERHEKREPKDRRWHVGVFDHDGGVLQPHVARNVTHAGSEVAAGRAVSARADPRRRQSRAARDLCLGIGDSIYHPAKRRAHWHPPPV